jgi:transcriptional regulator with XRE-family HTH domain
MGVKSASQAVAHEVLGRNVIRFRARRRVSQMELARITGISRTTISNVERGDGASSPTLDVIARFAEALGVMVHELLYEPSPYIDGDRENGVDLEQTVSYKEALMALADVSPPSATQNTKGRVTVTTETTGSRDQYSRAGRPPRKGKKVQRSSCLAAPGPNLSSARSSRSETST